jgi:hypothetical protein
MLSVWHAGAAIRPAPEPARTWVQRELSRPEYHESLLQRFFDRLGELWDRLQSTAMNASQLSTGAVVVVLVLLAVLVGLLLSRARRDPARLREEAALGARLTSPEQHRAAAEDALAARAFERALVEAFRAVAARSVQRGVLPERPGLTAHELAEGIAPVFPEQAAAVRDAAAGFDLVFYGGGRATAEQARSVLDLDERLRRTRPVPPEERSGDLAPAVPR